MTSSEGQYKVGEISLLAGIIRHGLIKVVGTLEFNIIGICGCTSLGHLLIFLQHGCYNIRVSVLSCMRCTGCLLMKLCRLLSSIIP